MFFGYSFLWSLAEKKQKRQVSIVVMSGFGITQAYSGPLLVGVPFFSGDPLVENGGFVSQGLTTTQSPFT